MNTATEAPSETRFTTEHFPLLLFFDGECAFCNRWVNKVKEADLQHRMRFGTKQGQTFQRVAQLRPEFEKVDSVVLVKRNSDGSEEFLVRSEAIREAIKNLPRFRFFDILLAIFPSSISNIGYRIFSKLRTPLFGKWHHCRVPLEEDKLLYVD